MKRISTSGSVTKIHWTKLEARLPKHPGGKLGKWFSWSGAKTICKPPY